MNYELYLLLMVVFSLMINIVIVALGIKTKSPENLSLLQALPTLFTFGMLSVGMELSSIWFPVDDKDGYGFAFLVVLPTMVFGIISTTVLGVSGLLRLAVRENVFFLLISALCATAIVTYLFAMTILPVAFVLILFVKGKRKWKQKRDKAPNIIG